MAVHTGILFKMFGAILDVIFGAIFCYIIENQM